MKYHDDGCDVAEAAVNEWLGNHLDDFRKLADECDAVALAAYRVETGFSPDRMADIQCYELHDLVWIAEKYAPQKTERSDI